MKVFSDSMPKAVQGDRCLLPNLHCAEALIATSDYSGQHKASRFECYTFVFANLEAWPEWDQRRIEVRKFHRCEGRRISFKKLGDGLKQRMLPDFLQAANLLPGLCVSVVIDKEIPSMFRKEGPLDFSGPDFANFSRYPRSVFEKLLRVVHFMSFFLAGLTRPGQNILWFTDQDDIAANDTGVVELTRVWGNILSHYLQHSLGHLRCGTTASDNGSLQVEDLAAIPDLVAGAMVDAMNNYAVARTLPACGLLVPLPDNVSHKAREIIAWFSEDGWPMHRLVFSFGAVSDSTAIAINRLCFHGA